MNQLKIIRQNHYQIVRAQSKNNLNQTLKNNYRQQNQHSNQQTHRSRSKSINYINNKKQLSEIPKIFNPEMVVSIDFAYNKIIGIPKHIQNLVQIRQIKLEHNCICRIDNIFGLKKLQRLNLSYNKICHVPEQITKLIKLQFLNLSFNNLSYISQVQSLKKLVKIRRQTLNGLLQISLDGNDVCNYKTQINKFKGVPQKNPTIQKLLTKNNLQLNNSLEGLSSIINSNKSQIIPLRALNIISDQKKLIVAKAISSKNINQSNQNKTKCNKQNMCPNFNICAQKNLSKELPVSIQNLDPFRQISTSSKKIQNQSLLISPNFKQLNKQNFSHNIISQKIMKDSQFAKLILENKQISLKYQQFQHKFTLLKQLQNIPDLVQKAYNQNTDLVLSNIKSVLSIFELKQREAFIFQETELIEYESNVFAALQLIQNNSKAIQQNHQIIVDKLTNQQTIELHWYKTWLYQYSKYKSTNSISIQNIFKYLKIWRKYQRVSQILDIQLFQHKRQTQTLQQNRSKQPNSDKKSINSQNLKQSEQIRLQKLLFSKDKSVYSQHSSIKKRSIPSTQKKQSNTKQIKNYQDNKFKSKCCFQCIIKDQEITNLKKQVNKMGKQLQNLSKQKAQINSQVDRLKDNKMLYQQICQQQKLIIKYINQLQPSTYQFMLLQQAKAIQSLFKYQNSSFQQKNPVDLSTKKINQCLTANTCTGIYSNSLNKLINQSSKTKNRSCKNYVKQKTVENQISEFVLPEAQQLQNSKNNQINYFRNSRLSKEQKQKTSINQSIKQTNKGQELSQKNKYKSNLSLQKQNESHRQIFGKQNNPKSKSKNKDFNFVYSSFKTQQFVSREISKGISQQKQIKQNQNLIKSNSDYFLTNKWPNTNNYEYDEINLMEKKQYKKYIDYHLRSNIEDILSKKKRTNQSLYSVNFKKQLSNINDNKIVQMKINQHNRLFNGKGPVFIKKQ